ncbi:MAG: nicotinate phosphoribosyltransferase, partial [Acetatifactor sp.]|nr:nicotinate phosphoribosyltransferase [Acetatifactor sp.]
VEENGEFVPRIKLSENEEKITNPGLKTVYRVYDADKKAIADLIALANEKVDFAAPYRYVDPKKPWKNRFFENCTAKALQVPIFREGRLVYDMPEVREIADYVKRQLTEEIWEEEQRFENPHAHYMDMTPAMYEVKMSMLNDSREHAEL